MTSERGTKDTERRVYQAVRAVPSGFVTTYGDIARTVGLRSPRQVGHVLAKGTQPAPWHRVVRSDGSLAEAVAPEQSRRLRAEGVDVAGARVDLKKYRW
jgi:methylated-DNA-protein-cysteine methyltransferase related protein